jgi:hypothetical protein
MVHIAFLFISLPPVRKKDVPCPHDSAGKWISMIIIAPHLMADQSASGAL